MRSWPRSSLFLAFDAAIRRCAKGTVVAKARQRDCFDADGDHVHFPSPWESVAWFSWNGGERRGLARGEMMSRKARRVDGRAWKTEGSTGKSCRRL